MFFGTDGRCEIVRPSCSKNQKETGAFLIFPGKTRNNFRTAKEVEQIVLPTGRKLYGCVMACDAKEGRLHDHDRTSSSRSNYKREQARGMARWTQFSCIHPPLCEPTASPHIIARVSLTIFCQPMKSTGQG